MRYLLDSNVIILALSGASEPLLRRLAACDEGDVVTSAITLAEILLGTQNGKAPPLEQLQAFVSEVRVLDFDYKAALAYAGLPFRRGGFDRLIAAHALSHRLTVVTGNTRHFADIPGLRVENWTR
ncbi:type II toxin-antitoxin system VapC family toxin [Sphingomonas sp. 2SG]|uniref:type II toxin-antitoxin system VapC family toxin n=1 Tax=Sphingomonas sp. 2SG TaxID=2502201 RepID=UPI0010FA4143|nr:type II toxin-antitoxin system VapC family toxin [Sphingomonas sp. 2SG]